jgi:PhnB protein
MQTKLNPYLSFKSNARQAMEFYKTVFGGTLQLNTFGDSGMSSDPSEDTLIMHAMLTASNGNVLMASDTPSHMEYKPGTNFSISLSGDDTTELTTYFNKLADGGTITQPLVEAPWGDIFGMVTDKFDIQWMVSIAQNKS